MGKRVDWKAKYERAQARSVRRLRELNDLTMANFSACVEIARLRREVAEIEEALLTAYDEVDTAAHKSGLAIH